MNSGGFSLLQQGIVEKIAKDNGWDLVSFDDEGHATLSSSRHDCSLFLAPDGDGETDRTRIIGIPLHVLLELGLPSQESRLVAVDLEILGQMLHDTCRMLLALPDTPLANYQRTLDAEFLAHPDIKGTEREATVRQRIGQDYYRQALMEYWNGTCALTGIKIPELLRASHAKPWAECSSDTERLSVFNGFLLSANADALFDRGLISFSDDGRLLISRHIDPNELVRAGIPIEACIRKMSNYHLEYLSWHRTKYGFSNHSGSHL